MNATATTVYTCQHFATCGMEDGQPVHAARCQEWNVEHGFQAVRPAAGHAIVVGIFHNTLNQSYYAVTPLGDGMERVEYLGSKRTAPQEAVDMVATAETMARVTGSREGRNRWEKDGVVTQEARWYANGYVVRLAEGVHRAQVTDPGMSPEQAALKAAMATQTKSPRRGMPYVVAVTAKAELPEGGAFAHRECRCAVGVTTYLQGVVLSCTAYADNSTEAVVLTRDGQEHRVTLVAPHGDICY